MGKRSSRRPVLVGLVFALAGLIVSTVLLTGSWPGERAPVADDFGATPATGAPTAGPARETVPAAAAAGGRSPSAPASATGPVAEPTSLALPRLDVRAPVDPVGVTGDGQVEVPKDPDRVGWYRYSPAPGSPQGSAVVVGHVDAKGRGLGVLDALNDVRTGDEVLVKSGNDDATAYRITARRTVSKRDLPSSEAFRRDGPAVLTLITCTGPYLPDRGGYQNNLVVTAVEAPK
ncbi:sortase domain-bontaining protein [Streptomyces sp. NPDC048737]|uniref:class F sortase n=1 Tax=unclassified Streptomyces TaxID=2593676 RepID=UPI0034128F0A